MAKAHYQQLEFERLSPETQLQRSREFLEHIRKRRTVRDFSAEPVPFELIQNAIAAAASAPSGANQQPWTFAVVSNPEIKRKIREAAEAEEKESYAHRMSEQWRKALEHLGTDWHKPHLEQAPYLIIVFAQAHGWKGEPEQSEKIKHYYVTESVGIAIGVLLTSLHLAGLATLTHTPSPMRFLSEILGRPTNERALVVIPVGYPAARAEVPVISKKSLDEVLVLYD